MVTDTSERIANENASILWWEITINFRVKVGRVGKFSGTYIRREAAGLDYENPRKSAISASFLFSMVYEDGARSA